jgi:hypothetical protein
MEVYKWRQQKEKTLKEETSEIMSTKRKMDATNIVLLIKQEKRRVYILGGWFQQIKLQLAREKLLLFEN